MNIRKNPGTKCAGKTEGERGKVEKPPQTYEINKCRRTSACKPFFGGDVNLQACILRYLIEFAPSAVNDKVNIMTYLIETYSKC